MAGGRAARLILGCSAFLLLAMPFIFDGCNAASVRSSQSSSLSVNGEGDDYNRVSVCEGHSVGVGSVQDVVVTAEERLARHKSASSSFTLKCKNSSFQVIPQEAGEGKPFMCTGNSTLRKCTSIALPDLGMTPTVDAEVEGGEKTVRWTMTPEEFPRTSQQLKVGCVMPSTGGSGLKGETGVAGCLITLSLPQGVPTVQYNVARCTYSKDLTVTPAVRVNPQKPLVTIQCGEGAEFVPSDRGYCPNEQVNNCQSRNLQEVLPEYNDSWWDPKPNHVLMVPVEALPPSEKKVFFGCALPVNTGEKKEKYYCAVPVIFTDAAPRHWSVSIMGGSTWWMFTLLLALYSCDITLGSLLNWNKTW